MHFRIGTLNAWALPGPFAEDVSARMRAIGARLAALDLDLMAFQEVWTAGARRRLIEAGPRAGLPYTWHSSSPIGGGGLLVLSRHPIERVHFERFSLRGQLEHISNGEFLSGKGFAEIELRTNAGPLTVVNTHLHASYGRSRVHGYRAERVGQIVQLASRSLRSPASRITVGDFNFAEEDPEYAVLTGLTGMRDAAVEVDDRRPTVLRSNSYRAGTRKPDRRIDFVFLDDGAVSGLRTNEIKRIFDEPIDLGGRAGAYSDHAGLVAEVELGRPEITRESPAPNAIALAGQLLARGRADAERRRRVVRFWSGAGASCASVAVLAGRANMSRRQWLRFSLRGAALFAVAPSVACSLMSEVFVPDEIAAFSEATARLARLEADAGVLPS